MSFLDSLKKLFGSSNQATEPAAQTPAEPATPVVEEAAAEMPVAEPVKDVEEAPVVEEAPAEEVPQAEEAAPEAPTEENPAQ